MTEKELNDLKVGDILYCVSQGFAYRIYKVKSINCVHNKDKRNFIIIEIYNGYGYGGEEVVVKNLYSMKGNLIQSKVQYYRIAKTNKMLQKLLIAMFNNGELMN